MEIPRKFGSINEGARLEQVTYILADGKTEIAVGWVKAIDDELLGDGYIALYQVNTGEHLLGTPEIISEDRITKREPLYTMSELMQYNTSISINKHTSYIRFKKDSICIEIKGENTK